MSENECMVYAPSGLKHLSTSLQVILMDGFVKENIKFGKNKF